MKSDLSVFHSTHLCVVWSVWWNGCSSHCVSVSNRSTWTRAPPWPHAYEWYENCPLLVIVDEMKCVMEVGWLLNTNPTHSITMFPSILCIRMSVVMVCCLEVIDNPFNMCVFMNETMWLLMCLCDGRDSFHKSCYSEL